MRDTVLAVVIVVVGARPEACAAATVSPDSAVAEPDSLVRAPAGESWLPLSTHARAPQDLRGGVEASTTRSAASQPGVRAVPANDRLAVPVLRGLSGGEVRMLDGTSAVRDFQIPDLDGALLDAGNAARVEVTLGPSSAVEGSDALAGIVRRVARALPAPGRDPRLAENAALFFDSADRTAGGRARVEGAAGELGWRIGGGARHSGDLSTPDGDLGPLGGHAWNGEGALGASLSGGRYELRYAGDGGTFDRPLPGTAGAPRSLRRELADHRLQWSGDTELGSVGLGLAGQWEHRSLDATLRGVAREPVALRSDAYALDLSGRHDAGRWRGVARLSGLATESRSIGTDPVIPGAHVLSGGAAGLASTTLGDWTITAAGRFDVRHLEALETPALALALQSRSFHEWSANLGAAGRPTPSLDVTIDVGRGWRAPTLFELYAHGAPPGRDRYLLGERRLEAQHALGVDAGAGWRSGALRAELSAFAQQLDGHVVLDSTDERRQSLPVFRFRSRDARLYGGEAGVRYDARAWLVLGATLDYVHGQDRTLDRPLSAIPPPRWTLEAVARSSLRAAGNATGMLRAELEGHGRVTRLGALDVPADPYALLNVDGELSWDRAVPIRVGLRLGNLAGTRVTEFPSPDASLAAGPGRSVAVVVEASR